jgi:hypothetical protein
MSIIPNNFRTISALLGLLLGIGMLILAYQISTNGGVDLLPTHPKPDPNGKSGISLQFYHKEIHPLIVEQEKRNLAAVSRAKAELDAQFMIYISRLPSYAEELTSWGMRYKITKAAISDWWSKDNSVRKIATEKFEEKVLSEASLKADVKLIINQFHSDLEANRNQMLTEATTRLKAANFPIPSLEVSEAGLKNALEARINPLLESQAKQSPTAGLLAIGGSILAEQAAQYIVVQTMRSLAVSLATTAAASGGATAAGGAAGGTAGTFLATPGVGTAIGVAVGIGVGIAVDSWMSGKFQKKVIYECQNVLNTMSADLWSDPAHGLEVTFSFAVMKTAEAHSASLKAIITGDKL